MSNPLFNALGGGMPQGNGPMQMIQQFMQFKQNFKGDPKEEVQKMLQSGKISQQQLNQVQQDGRTIPTYVERNEIVHYNLARLM